MKSQVSLPFFAPRGLDIFPARSNMSMAAATQASFKSMNHSDLTNSPASENHVPWYFRSLDFEQLWKDYPPPPTYFETTAKLSRDEMRSLQEKRFLQTVKRGWEIPFFKRHWSEHGIVAQDIRSLDDLTKIPVYDVHDIRKSIERNPPFGDFMGISPEDGKRMPLVLQTSGGTTGLPRPMLYSPQDRETMAILGGRRMAMHGIRPGDMVLVTLSLGLGNGGWPHAKRSGVTRARYL